MSPKIILKAASEWLPRRLGVITASELACLFKLNPYGSVNAMIKKKVEGSGITDSIYMRAGRIMEPGVIIAVNEALKEDFRLVTSGNLNEKVFYESDECLLGATPDAENVRGNLLEAKTCGAAKFNSWRTEPPAHYVLQLIAQIICCHSSPEGYLAVLSTEFPFKLIVWKFILTSELRSAIITEVNSFWDQIKNNNSYEHNLELIREVKLNIKENSSLVYQPLS